MTGLLEKFFPELEPDKIQQLYQLASVFGEWNARINLVSRKDMDAFVLHHLIHSLAMIKWIRFPERSRVLDVGTGGGLPGNPLAICFPETNFFLCDSITKKAKAVQSMVDELGLKNVQVVNKRAEHLESTWEFIIGRAVTSLPRFLGWIRDNIRKGGDSAMPNGVLYWKGSLYREELDAIGIQPFAVYPIEEKLDDPYFAGKYIIHLSRDQVLGAKLPVEE